LPEDGFRLDSDLRWSDLFIVQLGDSVATSFTTKHFVELGAICVLVEHPNAPTPSTSQGEVRESMSSSLNLGKKSVACDYASPEGLNTLRDLCKRADIVVRTPFDSDDVEDIWRSSKDELGDLIELVISPFGLTGPFRGYSGDSGTALAYGGVTYTSGDPDREPLTPPNEFAEFMAGAHGVVALLAALTRRARFGGGDFIDLSVLDSVVMGDEYNFSIVEANDLVRKRYYSRQLLDYPSDVFKCKDGYVALTGADFARLALLIERPDLEDSQFRSPHFRTQNWQELAALIEPFFEGRTVDTIVESAQSLRIPLAPVLFVSEMEDHPHLKARQAIVSKDHGARRALMVAPALQVREATIPDDPAPIPGEHDSKFLHQLVNDTTGASDIPADRQETSSLNGDLPLAGLRVVDFTHVWAGPACTRILSDLGADVIKIESPNWFDRVRHVRVMKNDVSGDYWNRSSYFHIRNAGKRAIAVDMNTEEGVDVLRKLVLQADVVAENFTPRVLRGVGLDYDSVVGQNPGLVMISMSAFGSTGPFANYLAFGMAMEAASGLSEANGYPEGPPRKSGTSILDPYVGVLGAGAIMAALISRQQTGKGQHIDFSQQLAGMSVASHGLYEYSLSGKTPVRRGNRSDRFAPQGCYPCRGDDNWIYISVKDDDGWKTLCGELDGSKLLSDPNFTTVAGRLENHDKLDTELSKLTKVHDKFDLMSRLQRLGVVAAALLDGEEVLADAHLAERGIFEQLVVGGYPASAQRYVPARFDSFTPRPATPAPTLGEHNNEVLGNVCGLSDEEIAALSESGVIGQTPVMAFDQERTARIVGIPIDQYMAQGSVRRRRGD
jgi:crotonobetainyl-CoA:carnitine CoA-transferase CaiB-like acyl-CoA transferase